MNGKSWTKISANKKKVISQHAVAEIDTAKFCTLSSSRLIPSTSSPTNKQTEKQDNEKIENSGNLTVVISVPTAIIAVAIIVLVVVQKNRKKSNGRKTRLDENPYYGQDEEYYEENTNRVEDTNQYYEG